MDALWFFVNAYYGIGIGMCFYASYLCMMGQAKMPLWVLLSLIPFWPIALIARK